MEVVESDGRSEFKDLAVKVLTCSEEEFYGKYFPQAVSSRFKFFGKKLSTCAITNAKSGKCPSDCKFCAQSSVSTAKINVYPLIEPEEIVRRAVFVSEFSERFSIVTSGISPSKEEIKKIGIAVEEIRKKVPKLKVCASLGFVKSEDLKFLKDCGLSRYHHNLETSESFYPKICSKQNWKDRVKQVEIAKEVGLEVCCGGIFGMGESEVEVAELLLTLRELRVNSVPVNFLHPIKGTPLENANYLTPLKCLRILTALRLVLKDTEIRICGGRELNLKELQPLSFLVADSLMVGDYLTTKGRKIQEDAKTVKQLGLCSSLLTQTESL